MTAHQTATAPLSIRELRADLKGRVIAPDDEDYDRARTVMAGGIDRRPAVIVKVADADDVADVVAPRPRDRASSSPSAAAATAAPGTA